MSNPPTTEVSPWGVPRRAARKSTVVRRPGPSAIQARTKDQDVQGAMKFSCSKHQITYYGPTDQKAECPMCRADETIADLRRTILTQGNDLTKALQDAERLRSHVDLHLAMRQALDIIGEGDLVWLKSVLYRWRKDKRIRLHVKHGPPTSFAPGTTRRKPAPPIGFTMMGRQNEVEEHTGETLGCIALAGYYEEALNLGGPATAIAALDKAVSKWMPGGQS